MSIMNLTKNQFVSAAGGIGIGLLSTVSAEAATYKAAQSSTTYGRVIHNVCEDKGRPNAHFSAGGGGNNRTSTNCCEFNVKGNKIAIEFLDSKNRLRQGYLSEANCAVSTGGSDPAPDPGGGKGGNSTGGPGPGGSTGL